MSPTTAAPRANIRPDAVRISQAREWWLITAMTLFGGVLRAWQFHHMAIEHFDEGVYASNLYCYALTEGTGFPFRHLYAPPLFPAVLEWVLIFTGSPAALMSVNVIAGTAMIPSLWWVGRGWFGPVAGLTAASLAAISPLHVQFSRAALTDVPLCFWMLWGVYWSWRGIWTGRPFALVLGGLFAALAWWTKYNGWLTLAVSGAGTLGWCAATAIRPQRQELAARPDAPDAPDDDWRTPTAGQAMVRWAITAAIAVLFWAPVPLELRDVGGYAAVSENHARYFVGATGWLKSLMRQADILSDYHPFVLVIAMAMLAGALMILVARGSIGPRAKNLHRGSRALAGWMTAAWFLGLLVAVPLYTPYPRLLLPWLAAAWLVLSLAAQRLSDWLARRSTRNVRSRSVAGAAIALLVAALTIAGFANLRLGVTADRRQLESIAGQLLSRLESDRFPAARASPQAVMVLGEPGLFFHLAAEVQQRRLSDSKLIVPAASYKGAINTPATDADIYLVTGSHAASLASEPPEVRARLIQVDELPYVPSDLVLLDEHGPAILQDRAAIPTEPIRLYRVQR